MLTLTTYLLACAVFLGAGFAKGVIGFGLNFIAIPTMVLILSGETAARDGIVMVTIVNFLNNFLLVAGWSGPTTWPQIRRIRPLIIAGIIGILAGSTLLVLLNPRVVTLIIGLLTIMFVLTAKARQNWRLTPGRDKIVAPLAGLTSGMMAGVSGIATPILVAYLYNLKLARRDFVYTLSVLFIIYSLVQVISYGVLGLYRLETVLISLTFVVPVMIGTWLGGRIQSKISQVLFNRLVLISLLILGLDLVRRAVLA
ncbi:MAG: hypothetical protein JWP00_2955 [Chloroflexi bacterium]|nr:hypothetical protein [Chloroflexota bacterium]